jgi:tetratricopeptide (TPR) repeat protein
MRNLRFWGRFFNNTLDERITEAALLRQAIYPEGSSEYWQSSMEGEKLAQRFELEVTRSSDEHAIYTERLFAGESARAKPTEKYLAIETEAVHHLFHTAKVLFGQGNFEKALARLNNIQYASLKFQNLEYTRALCLKSLGRYSEARQAELAELAINSHSQITGQDWPETLQLVTIGENPAIINPQLGPFSELRIRLMPVTLRLQVIGDVLASKPGHEWGTTFKELWARYRRRRLA